MRIFLAVDLPPSLREELAALQTELGQEAPRGTRWLNPAGIHLTLRFLGETGKDSIPPLDEALRVDSPPVASRSRFTNLGVFPPRGAPRLLWLGLEPTPALSDLHAWVENRVEAAGFSRDSRAFHPHLTLARFRPSVRRCPSALLAPTPGANLSALPLDEVVLFRSHLEPSGARYEPLQRYALSTPR